MACKCAVLSSAPRHDKFNSSQPQRSRGNRDTISARRPALCPREDHHRVDNFCCTIAPHKNLGRNTIGVARIECANPTTLTAVTMSLMQSCTTIFMLTLTYNNSPMPCKVAIIATCLYPRPFYGKTSHNARHRAYQHTRFTCVLPLPMIADNPDGRARRSGVAGTPCRRRLISRVTLYDI
jgi:hypothetical protein